MDQRRPEVSRNSQRRGNFRGRRGRGQRPQEPRQFQTFNNKKESQSSGRVGPFWGRFPDYGQEATEICITQSKQLQRGQLECIICMSKVGIVARIWNCFTCKKIFHYACIQKWSDKRILGIWHCPNCNTKHEENPTRFCFCGKQENPEPSPHLAPYTCGQTCGRQRAQNCPHPCSLPCHPGTCPPCHQVAPLQPCYCGKTQYQPLCKEKHVGQSCGSLCEKLLSCEKHYCNKICHQNDCDKCSELVQSSCWCGKFIKEISCGDQGFQCDQMCGKVLNCGNHTCQRQCHQGECFGCELTPEHIDSCYCGQMYIKNILDTPRQSCLDPIPQCGNICQKMLKCGHLCQNPCHPGDCSQCPLSQTRQCRCGTVSKLLACATINEEFKCNRPCNLKKSCKKHRCEEKCCPGLGNPEYQGHRCYEQCGKVLNCGIHSCIMQCHFMECEPCPVIYRNRVYCACGSSYKEPPLRCGTIDMDFKCVSICGKDLPCGHSCSQPCHMGECPDCVLLTYKRCNCGAIQRPVKCNDNQVTCSNFCKKLRECGHICGKKCHKDQCNSSQCDKICMKKRENCDHSCNLKCHPDSDCSLYDCTVEVKRYCDCGMQFEIRQCHDQVKKQCDQECESLQRKQKVFEALRSDGTNPDVYSEYLASYAKSDPLLLKRLEAKLNQFLYSQERNVTLPQMRNDQRAFCHSLIQDHYNMDTLSLDQGQSRTITVYRTGKARIPNPLLSEFLRQLSQGKVVVKEERQIEGTIALYQLQYQDTEISINDELQKWNGDYFIEWVNNHSCNLHFFNLHKCSEVSKYLKSKPGSLQVHRFINKIAMKSDPGYKKRFQNAKQAKQEVQEEVKQEEVVEQEEQEESEEDSYDSAENLNINTFVPRQN